MAAYRPEALVHKILAVPVPTPSFLPKMSIDSLEAVDEAVFQGFGLKDAERVLIEDMAAITIPDFRGDRPSPGAAPTSDASSREDILQQYCDTFFKVLKSGFGMSKRLGATISRSPEQKPAPYRLVAIQLLEDNAQCDGINIETVGRSGLI